MTAPQRVKVAGDLFHGQVPTGAVYVGRGAPSLPASLFANPFRIRFGIGRSVSAETLHYPALEPHRRRILDQMHTLAGCDLACWCPVPDDPAGDECHGASLLWRANRWPRPAGAAFAIRDAGGGR